MTDFELNKAIAEALGLIFEVEDGFIMVCEKPEISTASDSMEKIGTMDNGNRIIAVEFNPCGNWNDLMPLVVERGISLKSNKRDNEWIASSNLCSSRSERTQRALAECLLKVLNK